MNKIVCVIAIIVILINLAIIEAGKVDSALKPSKETVLRQFIFKLSPKVKNGKKWLEETFNFEEPSYLPGRRFLVTTTQRGIRDLVNQYKGKILRIRKRNRRSKVSQKVYDQLVEEGDGPIELNVFLKHNGRSGKLAYAKYRKEDEQIKEYKPYQVDRSLETTYNLFKKRIPELRRLSNNKWRVKTNRKLIMDVLKKLVKHHHVHYIEPRERFVNHGFEQVLGDVDPLSELYGSFLSEKKEWVHRNQNPGVKKLWKLGFTGKGQVIGIGDTGINTKNCMFQDSEEREVPFVDQSNFDKDTESEHEKIKAYYTFGDNQDLEDGHGTHVSGVAVGKAQSEELSYLNGIQYDSKVAFLDIGTKHGLSLPDDLTKGYFPYFKAQGAKIISNSWGSTQVNGYSLSAREVDEFLYDNPDTLALFAAGNSGRSGDRTLTTPGISKNALTVGASQGNLKSFVAGSPLYALHLQGQFKKMLSNKNSPIYRNPAFCVTYKKKAPCTGIFDRVQAHFKHSSDFCRNAFTRKLTCTTHLEKLIRKYPERYARKNLATFSSRGPTPDNRIKPDLIASGQPIFSARSSSINTCPVPLVLQGTSQATPLMAGYAGMIRQYFLDGYYPSGKPNKKDSFEPTGALIKAMLLASGKNMDGSVDLNGQGKWAELKPKPSIKQGFGLVDVESVLRFEDSEQFLFQDTQSNLETGDLKEYCFKVTSPGANFKATLTWMDRAPHPSARVMLVNDLDLTVDAYGSAEQFKRFYPNNQNKPDRRNNVEQVDLENTPKDLERIIVTVKGHHIPAGPSGFALVVNGKDIETC